MNLFDQLVIVICESDLRGLTSSGKNLAVVGIIVCSVIMLFWV